MGHKKLILLIILSLVLGVSNPVRADDFNEWLAELRAEALAEGISQATLDEALSGVSLLPIIIEKDRNQPEFKMSLDQYLARLVSEKRISEGRARLAEHRELLRQVKGRYKIPPRYLIAFWGIESDYGRTFGDFPVIDSLVTLAYDPRRSNFFRRELIQALHLVNDGIIKVNEMDGSWAGAMGGLQFLPSVLRKYGVDHDSDGRIDIWHNPGDLFSSAARYLKESGWQAAQGWGWEVELPAGLDRSRWADGSRLPVSDWRDLGLRQIDGRPLPAIKSEAWLVTPELSSPRTFLVQENFLVILKWNRAPLFAISVGQLADSIGR